MITLNTRITSLQIAKDWLAEFSPSAIITEDDKVKISDSCGRCGGSGSTGHFVDGGVCYACRGINTRNSFRYVPIKEYAQEEKSKRIKIRKDIDARIQKEKESAERLTKLREKWDAEKDLADDCPTGKIVVTGEVMNVKTKHDEFYGTSRLVMTVKSPEGWLVWGTIPKAINPNKGDIVRFTATVTPSEEDPKFGFTKSPSKASIEVKKNSDEEVV